MTTQRGQMGCTAWNWFSTFGSLKYWSPLIRTWGQTHHTCCTFSSSLGNSDFLKRRWRTKSISGPASRCVQRHLAGSKHQLRLSAFCQHWINTLGEVSQRADVLTETLMSVCLSKQYSRNRIATHRRRIYLHCFAYRLQLSWGTHTPPAPVQSRFV